MTNKYYSSFKYGDRVDIMYCYHFCVFQYHFSIFVCLFLCFYCSVRSDDVCLCVVVRVSDNGLFFIYFIVWYEIEWFRLVLNLQWLHACDSKTWKGLVLLTWKGLVNNTFNSSLGPSSYTSVWTVFGGPTSSTLSCFHICWDL